MEPFQYDPKKVVVEEFKEGTEAEARIDKIWSSSLQTLYGGAAKLNRHTAEQPGIEMEVWGEVQQPGKTGIPFKTRKIFGLKHVDAKSIVVGGRSDIGKFIRKYGKPPEEDMMVQCRVNEEGYWEVVIE
jgi:hypothetical protein